MSRKIERPNAAEEKWIRQNVEAAAALGRKYGGDPPTSELASLAALDAVWVAFSDAIRKAGGDPNKTINMLGLAFGAHFVRSAGLAWAVVTDEYGTDIAVRGEPGELLVFPTNLVAKRWDSREGAFMERLFPEMCADIEIMRSAAR